jgi:glutamine amidotransferase-like uncharacterized protein
MKNRTTATFGALLFAVLTSCDRSGETVNPTASILLFDGEGTSVNDVKAIAEILRSRHLDFSGVSSAQLNHMSEAGLKTHRLLIVPGGNFINIGNGLKPGTSANVRHAVQSGLNYLGICAGAFFGGDSRYNGLNLTDGVRFGFYSDENRGIRKEPVVIADAEVGTLDQYWEDGPQLTGWGTVVAKYPDGTPAVVEGTSGKGWVILSGVHPEAPADWRRGMQFNTPVSVDHDYAARLIDAALKGTRLAHY